jgi:hypothetical protein
VGEEGERMGEEGEDKGEEGEDMSEEGESVPVEVIDHLEVQVGEKAYCISPQWQVVASEAFSRQ